VLVAVSGGADSVALLRGLSALAGGEAGVEPVVAHLDHGLRAESAADAEWVVALAEGLGLDSVLWKTDVARTAAEKGLGIEEAARRVRYDFLAAAADSRRCTAVAVAHTADDQVETVLHHVVRGTGLSGLRGMPRERPLVHSVRPDLRTRLVRPLLGVARAEIEAYLAALGQPFLVDATNRDPAFTRNRIRSELLPLLEESFNPRVREALLRLASQASEAVAVVDGLAATLLDAALVESESPGTVRLDVAAFASAPEHVARAALVELWRRRDWPRQGMGASDWQRLLEVIRDGGAVMLAGGIEGRRRGNVLVVRRVSGEKGEATG
jgi:tRNA(Ile)-lysidine synthase